MSNLLKISKIFANCSMNLSTEQEQGEQKKEQEWGILCSDVLNEFQGRESAAQEADACCEEQQGSEEASSTPSQEEKDQPRDHIYQRYNFYSDELEEICIDTSSLVDLKSVIYLKDGDTKPFYGAAYDSRGGCVVITLPDVFIVVEGIDRE